MSDTKNNNIEFTDKGPIPGKATPYYAIDEGILDEDCETLRAALEESWSNYILSYSVKTNSLPWLLSHLRAEGFRAEIVSDLEYDIARRVGFDENKMIYNGPIKDMTVFDSIIAAGGMVNIDSLEEIEHLEATSRCLWQSGDAYAENTTVISSADNAASPDYSSKVPAGFVRRVGIRVNCDMHKLVPEETSPDEDSSRFGFCLENGELGKAIARLRALPDVKISGLHLHCTTKNRSVEGFRAIAGLACEIADSYDLDPEYIDIGGGFWGGVKDKPGYKDYIPAIAEVLARKFDPARCALAVEPGVSLISRCSCFATKVVGINHVRDDVYVITDGSRLNLNPQITRRHYPHHNIPVSRVARRVLPGQWVCGFTCMEYDRLFEEKDSPEFMIGDYIIYDLAGGYTLSLNPTFIRSLPAVYIERTDGTVFTARDPWGAEEAIAGSHWL